MTDATSTPDRARWSGWPDDPPAQMLLVASLALACLFVSAGGYLLLVLAGLAMPWLTAAYVASHRDDAQLSGPAVDGRSIVGLGGLLLYPAMVFRALFDTDFDTTALAFAVPCAALGALCLGVWLWVDPVARRRPPMARALALQAWHGLRTLRLGDDCRGCVRLTRVRAGRID